MRAALVNAETVVVNIIKLEPDSDYTPDSNLTIVPATVACEINGTYDGTNFHPAPIAVPSAEETNHRTLEQQAATAMETNRTFIALAPPTAAQVTAQVKALSRQNNGLIRIMLARFDGTD